MKKKTSSGKCLERREGKRWRKLLNYRCADCSYSHLPRSILTFTVCLYEFSVKISIKKKKTKNICFCRGWRIFITPMLLISKPRIRSKIYSQKEEEASKCRWSSNTTETGDLKITRERFFFLILMPEAICSAKLVQCRANWPMQLNREKWENAMPACGEAKSKLVNLSFLLTLLLNVSCSVSRCRRCVRQFSL